MKIMVYCQHVLGIGHLCRIMLILRQLAEHRVTLILGGPPVQLAIPAHVQVIQLPGLEMDENFSGLLAVESGNDVEMIKQQRDKRLQTLFIELQPDLLLIELFPFGRNAFRFELLPLLQQARDRKKCKIVCSVRDILVDRDNTIKFEQRVIERLNRYFHLLLVHGDPQLIRLNKTFSRMADVKIPVSYTGYICEPPIQGDRERIRNKLQIKKRDEEQLIVVSAGSGSVGNGLLQASVDAFSLLAPELGCRMQLFTGPYISKDDFKQLSLCVSKNKKIRIGRFSDNFSAWLAAADLSISMGGYNTTMNLIVAGCRALVYPFAQNHEQRMRAEQLQQRGLLQVLTDLDLQPERLAEKITRALTTELRRPSGIMLEGASRTALELTRLCQKNGNVS